MPFLFNIVLDTVSAQIQDQPPWLMMYADDIALIDENQLMLERKVNLNVSKTEYIACGSPDTSNIFIGPGPAVKSEKVPWIRHARVGRHRSRCPWPDKRCLGRMVKGHWCGRRLQITAQAQGADIEEHHPTGLTGSASWMS